MYDIQDKITFFWKKKELWNKKEVKKHILYTIKMLNIGNIKICNFNKKNNKWIINKWIKKTIMMYFYIKKIRNINFGEFNFFDKIPIKSKFTANNIRLVPPAVVRYGSYVSDNTIIMPSYINIGAYIGKNCMIDTWATVGSCAQIGNRVHISGGVGIGGVIEPIQDSPVIIEDDVFVGSRSIIVEGILVKKGSVIAANVVITSSTHILDVTNSKVKKLNYIPEYSVVIPGSYSKKFKCGNYNIPCALIIGKRKKKTNAKLLLNNIIRDY